MHWLYILFNFFRLLLFDWVLECPDTIGKNRKIVKCGVLWGSWYWEKKSIETYALLPFQILQKSKNIKYQNKEIWYDCQGDKSQPVVQMTVVQAVLEQCEKKTRRFLIEYIDAMAFLFIGDNNIRIVLRTWTSLQVVQVEGYDWPVFFKNYDGMKCHVLGNKVNCMSYTIS